MLLEVLVSAVIVALIAVGTYTGLVSSGRATAHERGSAQALVLAQQDEERLRGLSIEHLAQLGPTTYSITESGLCLEEKSGGWYYYSGATQWKTGCEAIKGFEGKYTGAVYTVTSQAEYVNEEKEEATCEAGGAANYIKTTSTVTWSSIGSHEPVTQSSLVDEPSSATLMVKVKNRNNEPVSGATVEAFDPTSASTATVTETTPSSGCVTIGALTEGEVKLIASNGDWVTRSGKTAPEKITSVKKGSLAEAEFTLEAPGTIEAKFINEATTKQYVKGFTFVAYQSEAASSAPFYVGGEASKAATSATYGPLFPFVMPGKPWKPDEYTVYAGDCEANNPAVVTGNTVKAPTVQVEPSVINQKEVEEPEVKVTVYEGTSSKSGNKLNSTSAKIINSECKGQTAQTAVPYEHEDPVIEGSLEFPYLPYAKTYELCVAGKVEGNGYKYKKSLSSYTNTSKKGTTWPTIYLKGEGTKTTESC